jgi:hypothetical protein
MHPFVLSSGEFSSDLMLKTQTIITHKHGVQVMNFWTLSNMVKVKEKGGEGTLERGGKWWGVVGSGGGRWGVAVGGGERWERWRAVGVLDGGE